MKKLTDKLWHLKDRLTYYVQPITQEQILHILHSNLTNNPVTETYVLEDNTIPLQLNSDEKTVLQPTLKEWAQNIAYDTLLEKVIKQSQESEEYMIKMSEKEDLVNKAQKLLAKRGSKPYFQRLLQEFDVEGLNCQIVRVKEIRQGYKKMREAMIDSNNRIQQLLIKKRNMAAYLEKLKGIKEKLKLLSNRQYAAHQIQTLNASLSDRELQSYQFYESLAEYIQNQIVNFQGGLAERFCHLLLHYSEEDVMNVAFACLRLDDSQKKEISTIYGKGFKQAVTTILERILVRYVHSEDFVDLTAMLRMMNSKTSMQFMCSTLTEFENLLKNGEKILGIFDQSLQNQCIKSTKHILRSYIEVFVQEFKQSLFCHHQQSNLPIIDLLLVFCTEIFKDEELWKDISMFFTSIMEYQQGETISQIDTDLESESWSVVCLDYSSQWQILLKYIKNKFQISYPEQLVKILTDSEDRETPTPTPTAQHNSQSIQVLFSTFNCLRYLDSKLFYMAMFSSCSQFLKPLMSSYSKTLEYYIANLISRFVNYGTLNVSEGVGTEVSLHYPNIYEFTKKNSSIVMRQCQSSITEPTESIAEAMLISFTVLRDRVKQHQELILSIDQSHKISDIDKVLEELPGFINTLAIQNLINNIDVSEIRNPQWLDPTNPIHLQNFLDSFKLLYCRIRNPQNQIIFTKKMQYTIIHYISSLGNLKKHQYQRAIDQYNTIYFHLSSVNIPVTKQVTKYLTVKMTKENDQSRIELAKSKLGSYSSKSIVSLVKDKTQLEDLNNLISKVGLGFIVKKFAPL